MAAAEPSNLRVLSQNLNVHHLVSHSSDKDNRIDKFLEMLEAQGYDIVLLQELFVLSTFLGLKKIGLDLRSKVIERARAMGFNHVALSKPATSFFGQDSGLVILSKFPIAHEYSVAFREWGWKEMPNKKGILHAVLELPSGMKLNIVNCHMDAHERLIRDQQVKQLRAHLQGHISTDGFTIVGGDMNIDFESPEFKQLRNQLHPMRDGWGQAEGHPGTNKNSQCVDYLFYSPNITTLEQRRVPSDGYSDHAGVHGTFTLMADDAARLDAPKP